MRNYRITLRYLITLILAISTTIQIHAQKIPFQLLPSGHIVVSATVDGKPGSFIFDTGGGINLFFDDYAKGLNQQSTYNFLTAFRATGERMDIPLYHQSDVLFAGKKFTGIPFSTFNMKLNGINGLISLQMFKDTDFIIDYDRKEIVLTKLSAKSSKKQYDIQLSALADNSIDIFTYITLNDQHKIQVLLDSGAGNDSFWLNGKLISLLGLEKTELDLSEKKSEFNENVITKFYRGTINSISNDYATVKNPKVVFVDGLIYEGKTSINWLGKRIGISIKNKKIYILD